jgi:hypothetical protein
MEQMGSECKRAGLDNVDPKVFLDSVASAFRVRPYMIEVAIESMQGLMGCKRASHSHSLCVYVTRSLRLLCAGGRPFYA